MTKGLLLGWRNPAGFALLASCGLGAAAERTPLTVADIVGMRRLTAVAISADGSRVAFAVEEPNDVSRSKEPTQTTLWSWTAGADKVQRHAAPAGKHSGLKWLPDGKLAFAVASPGRNMELWHGDKPVLSRGGAYAWSPDGKSLAYLASRPESPEEVRKKDLGHDEIHVRRSGPDRPALPSQLFVTQPGATPERSIQIEGQNPISIDWRPDGSGFLVTTASPEDIEQFQHRIYVVPAGEGAPAQYCDPRGRASGASWSPDGKAVAFLGTTEGFSDFFPGALYVCDGEGAMPKNLIADSPFSVEAFRWMPDGKSFVVVIAQGAHRALARLHRDGRLERLTQEPYQVAFRSPFSVSRDGRTIACILSSSSQPPDVWMVRPGAPSKRITDLNPGLAHRDYGASEEVRWRAEDGLEIPGVLILPVGYRKGTRYPMVVQVHGSQVGDTTEFQGSWMNWGQLLAGRGFAVLLPNYRGSLTNGAAYGRKFQGDLGGKDLNDIFDGVQAMIDRGIADADRIGIGGVSYGGFLTALATTRSSRFKAAVMGIGLSNWVSMAGQTPGLLGMVKFSWLHSPYERADLLWDRSPLAHAKNVKTPTFIYAGENDPVVPVSQSREYFRALRHFSVPSEFIIYPREGHSVLEPLHLTQNLEAIAAWFERYLQR